MKEVIHIEFDMVDDVEVQPKNANDRNAEGKVRVKKKMVHYYEFSSKDKSKKQATPKKLEKTKDGHEKPRKMMKMIKPLSPRK